MKRLFFLAVMILPVVAEAQYFMSGGIGYHVLSAEEHTVEVTGKSSGSPYQGNISIPATVVHDGVTYDVVALGNQAFYGSSLSGITIPTSVRRIEYGCFLFANGPATINVPASVTRIDELAFAANNLNTINVDDSNPSYRSIGGMLFSKDTATIVECPVGRGGTVTLPQNTRHIAPYAFAYCQNITGVTLHEGLSSIGYWAFVDNRRLNNVAIPSSVTYIGASPFVNCLALNNLSIAEGNSHYYLDGMMIYSAGGDTLVSAHKSADSVFLSGSLRVVNGFGGNNNVRYIHVPDGVTTIGNEAFNGSTLEGIDLPSHLDFIGEYAFYYCQSLTRVGMPTSLDSMGEGCFHSCRGLTSIAIPNGLRTVSEGAFFMCTSLSNVTWGDAVEVIDTCAFGDCSFVELTLPPTLRVVRQAAFIGDYNGRLDEVVFSAAVDTIESDAFYFQGLSLLYLPNNVPPVTTDDGCLNDVIIERIIILCGRKSAYLADSYWGQTAFADKYHEDCEGIETMETQYEMTVYPNPTTGRVAIAVPSAAVAAWLTDPAGRREEVRLVPDCGTRVAMPDPQDATSSAQYVYTIDLSDRPQAVYLLTLIAADGKPHSVKLLKK